MEFVIKNKRNRHLIILIHGLNGGESSWRGEEGRFIETLSNTSIINENFDVALFVYGTTIFTINWFKKLINTILGFFKSRPKENIKGFNVGINSISQVLNTEIRGVHNNYDTITFITHSMGGLVSKSAMTWFINEDEILKKNELFISLSVPHVGSHLASVGKMIPVLGDNPQILDLQTMGDFTTQLNARYASLKYLPKIIYQNGNQDTVVPRASAIPNGVANNLVVSTNDDHFSVLLINDSSNNTLYNRILEELNNVLQPFMGIEVDVPNGATLGFLINTIVSKNKLKVDTSCFSKQELDVILREEKISSSTVEDLFIKIGSLAMTKLPEYTVSRERGALSYLFRKV